MFIFGLRVSLVYFYIPHSQLIFLQCFSLFQSCLFGLHRFNAGMANLEVHFVPSTLLERCTTNQPPNVSQEKRAEKEDEEGSRKGREKESGFR